MALAIVFRSVGVTCAGEGSADTRAEAYATLGDQSGGDLVQHDSDPTGIGSGPERLRATQLPEAVPAGRGLGEERDFRLADRERNTGPFDQGDVPGDVQGDIRPDYGRDRGQVVRVPQRWDSMSTRPISEADGNRLVLTVAEAAGRLGISSDLAYDLVARGELPSLRLGRRIVIPRIALLAFVESATGSGRIHRGFRAIGR